MATISSAGIGSGLDVSSIVDKLVAIERQPIDNLKTKAETIQTKLSSFGLLSSYMTNLGDIAAKLSKSDFWSQTTAASSDGAAVAVTSTASAAPGSYAVEVTQLAKAQTLASKAYADKTASVGTGTLHIQTGSWEDGPPPSFTPNAARAAIDVPVIAGADSLESIKEKINAAGAGVTASIVTDGHGARLVLRSTETGMVSAVRISATDDDGADADAGGLSALAYDPATAAAQMTQTQAAQDASATINGLAVTSSSNTLDNVVDGVTLRLDKVTSSPVEVKVSVDTDAQRAAIKSFAQAFSDINTYIGTQTKYDATSKKAAALQGDRATLTLQGTLRSLLQSQSSASGSYARLADIGIEAQANGSYTVNDTKLTAALAKPGELSKLFAATSASADASSGPSPEGYAVRAKALATQLSGSNGLITTATKGLRDSISRNSAQQETLETRVALVKARLTKQYSALDTTMSQISATNSQLTQSLTSLTSLMTSIANNSN